MDRELNAEELRRLRWKRIITGCVIIFVVVLLLFGIRQLLGRRIERSRLVISVAEPGVIEGTITASGAVVPAYEQTLSSPFISRIDSVYRQAGDEVKKGDRLLKLNIDYMELQHEKAQDEYELMQNEMLQRQLQKAQKSLELDTERQIKELQVATFENELAIQQRLYELGGGMQSSVDRAQLNLDIGRLELGQLEARILNEEQMLEVELTGLELRMSIKRNEILQLEQELKLADMGAEFQGVVTWINDTPGISVNKGEALARIADLTSFKIKGAVSDYYADKLTTGNPVYLSISGNRLDGLITSIEPTVRNNIITFYAELYEKNNLLLRSNMRVDISIITTTKSGVVRIKNGPAINGKGLMPLFIDHGNWAEKRMVRVGETNLDFAEIVSGITFGERVIISRMEDYESLKKIKIIE
ncbi:MAG: efflux RND transporter periplasmic adaptor subunit [Candidatus Cloacimonetes bacterium]|nr:efflux RND transporter periplasmic adaptor subunit [Candidatus Cloacimonadota bacterium]